MFHQSLILLMCQQMAQGLTISKTKLQHTCSFSKLLKENLSKTHHSSFSSLPMCEKEDQKQSITIIYFI